MLLAALALAAAPTWPVLTPEEHAALDARRVVLRAAVDGRRTVSTGIVHVGVPPESLWPAVLDFEARIPENPSLVSVEEYRRDGPWDWYVRFEMRVFGIRAVIHDRWTCEMAASVCTWTLDPARDSDLVMNEGWLMVRPDGVGSVLAFHDELQAKMWAPGWVQRWLAEDSMENVLAKIRDRAERR